MADYPSDDKEVLRDDRDYATACAILHMRRTRQRVYLEHQLGNTEEEVVDKHVAEEGPSSPGLPETPY